MSIVGPTWADSLFLAACVLLLVAFLCLIVQSLARRTYYNWLNNPSTPLDVDAFVNIEKNPPKYVKIAFLQKLSVGDRAPSNETVKLASAESPHVNLLASIASFVAITFQYFM